MISTFMGLETAKRGLSTSQGALYTTGNNVANANTLGYSRQRVNLVQTSGFPTVGLNSPRVARSTRDRGGCRNCTANPRQLFGLAIQDSK